MGKGELMLYNCLHLRMLMEEHFGLGDPKPQRSQTPSSVSL